VAESMVDAEVIVMLIHFLKRVGLESWSFRSIPWAIASAAPVPEN